MTGLLLLLSLVSASFAEPAHQGPEQDGQASEAPTTLGGGLGTANTLGDSDSKIQLGVFRPWSIRLTRHTDIKTTGIVGSIVSPNVQVKHQLVAQGTQPLSVAMVIGANSPTPVLNLAKGWLYGADDAIPFAMQGRVGVLASRQYNSAVISAGAYFRAGFAAGDSDLTPRDFYFVDFALAPIAEGPMGLFTLQGDLSPSDRVLLSVRLSMQVGSADGIDLQSRWFALLAPGEHTAFGLGFFTHQDPRPEPVGAKHFFIPGADFQLRY